MAREPTAPSPTASRAIARVSSRRSRTLRSCDFRNGGRCRLTAGAEYGRRTDESDNGANTVASPRVLHDSTGALADGFIFIRPLELFDPTKKSPFSVVARYDHFTPQTDPNSSVPGAANYAGTTPAYNFVVLGRGVGLNQRMTLTADYQNQSPTDFPAADRHERTPDGPVDDLVLALRREFLIDTQLTHAERAKERLHALFGSTQCDPVVQL